MSDIFETANLLSILLAGRRPQWTDQPSYTGMPASSGAGVYLEDSPRTAVLVDLRREIHRRTVVFTVRVLDLTGTYRIQVDGNTVNYDASIGLPADIDELLTQWATTINADVTVGAIVLATPVDTDGDGDADELHLTGLDEADYSIAYQTFAGTAEVDLVADASTGIMRLYLQEKPPNGGNRWRQPNNANYPLTLRGFAERFETSGFDRAYVELGNITGHASDAVVAPSTLTYWSAVTIGPAVDERLA